MGSIKPFNSNQVIKPLARTTMFVLNEAREAGENDPALAVRLAAGGLVAPIMSGVNTPGVAEFTDHTLVPIVRGMLLGANIFRAQRTFKDPNAKAWEKGADVVRVVSDTAGLIGGLAVLFTPQYAALGAKLIGTAYSVDICSHAIRGMTHVSNRMKVWNAMAAEADKPDNKPPGPGGPGDSPKPPVAPPADPPKLSGLNKPLTQFDAPKQLNLFKN